MKIRVGVCEHGRFEVESRVTDDGNPMWLVKGVRIGHGFHWQQEMDMLLPGDIEVEEHEDGSRSLINVVDLEDYLECVISSEMSGLASLEFLKAHAIISRSWAIGKMEQEPQADAGVKADIVEENHEFECGASEFISWEDADNHKGFDVCSDDHCQRYQGRGEVNEQVKKAIHETSGMVLADCNGKLCDARFSKCCGGRTEVFSTCWQDLTYPYLVSKEDPWCKNVTDEVLNRNLKGYDRLTKDYYDWTAHCNKAELRTRIKEKYGVELGKIDKLEAIEYGASGRIKRLRIIGEESAIVVGKELPIRRLLAERCLYSSWFSVEDRGEDFVLHGHGWGHGVGLCQIGAAAMAEAGHSCEEILKFYYPNSKIVKL